MYTYFVKTKTPRIAIYSNKALVETQQEKSRHATHTTISPLKIDEDINSHTGKNTYKTHDELQRFVRDMWIIITN